MIFHSYVKLPEGTLASSAIQIPTSHRLHGLNDRKPDVSRQDPPGSWAMDTYGIPMAITITIYNHLYPVELRKANHLSDHI